MDIATDPALHNPIANRSAHLSNARCLLPNPVDGVRIPLGIREVLNQLVLEPQVALRRQRHQVLPIRCHTQAHYWRDQTHARHWALDHTWYCGAWSSAEGHCLPSGLLF